MTSHMYLFLMNISWISTAMYNLASHYDDNQDWSNTLKYYLMAINCGNSNAMNALAINYACEHDYEHAMKYWFLAIDHNNYECAETVLTLCQRNGLVDWGIVYYNRLLNRLSNHLIMGFIIGHIDKMNANMVNIIINMESDYALPCKLKY